MAQRTKSSKQAPGNTSKIIIIGSMLLMMMATVETQAAESRRKPSEQEQNRQLTGLFTGATAGGMIAGPPGIIIGAISGVFIGHSINEEKGRANAEHRLQALELSYSELQQEHHHLQAAAEAAQDAQFLAVNMMREQAREDCCHNAELVLHFRTGSSDVEAQYRSDLAHFSRLLRDHPEAAIEITGHADPRGEDSFNLSLSERRVQAVTEILQAQGLSRQQLVTRAHGARQAQGQKEDPESLFFDRRVTVRARSTSNELLTQGRN